MYIGPGPGQGILTYQVKILAVLGAAGQLIHINQRLIPFVYIVL